MNETMSLISLDVNTGGLLQVIVWQLRVYNHKLSLNETSDEKTEATEMSINAEANKDENSA